MIASPHVKYDTFGIEASEDHTNYDIFDLNVLENTINMQTF